MQDSRFLESPANLIFTITYAHVQDIHIIWIQAQSSE